MGYGSKHRDTAPIVRRVIQDYPQTPQEKVFSRMEQVFNAVKKNEHCWSNWKRWRDRQTCLRAG